MIWEPDCNHIRLIRFGDELERIAAGRFDLSIDRPADGWPERGDAGALLWLAFIFAAEGCGATIPAAADFFGISESRAVSLLTDRGYRADQRRDHLAVAAAVRDYALNQCTSPARRFSEKQEPKRLKVFRSEKRA